MTLHATIELILQKEGKAMTASEIAHIINKEKLYNRKDNLPVPASQVSARANNYSKIFSKDFGKIKLKKNDIVFREFSTKKHWITSLVEEEYTKGFRPSLLPLYKALNEYLPSEEIVTLESQLIRSENKLPKRARCLIVYKLSQWFFENYHNHSSLLLSNELVNCFCKLSFFQNKNQIIQTSISGYNSFLLKIVAENPDVNFSLNINNESNIRRDDSNNKDINDLIAKLISEDNNQFNQTKSIETSIIIPNFAKKLSTENIPSEFNTLLKQINSDNKKINHTILLIPLGSLTNISEVYKNTRREIVKSKSLQAVVSLPKGSINNTGVNLALLIFNFTKKVEGVFFLDASNREFDDIENLAQYINNHHLEKDFSKITPITEINNHEFNLNPAKYVFNLEDIDVKRDYKLYTIKSLVKDDKKGKRIPNKESIYSGGECKIIRTTELNKDSLYFKSNKNMLGVDYDILGDHEKNLITGGIVLSAFNKKVKACVLPSDERFLLASDVYWLKLNNKLITDEYFVKEFEKMYVLKQVQVLSKGVAIFRLSMDDLMKIKLQVPSIVLQNEILLNELKEYNITSITNEISSSEKDFIKTLKHTLKQPISVFANDFTSLKSFIESKTESKEPLNILESIVPIFDSDTEDQKAKYSLINTMERMERAIGDMDYVLKQAVEIISISEPVPEYIEIKQFLKYFISDYPEITIKIFGEEEEVLADRKQLRILIHNFINNAIKHGFKKEIKNPTIWFDVKPLNNENLQISIRNNGVSLPQEFTIEDFLAKGYSSKSDVGSGFGGYLIGLILKKNNGSIKLENTENSWIKPYNVEFKITLPKYD